MTGDFGRGRPYLLDMIISLSWTTEGWNRKNINTRTLLTKVQNTIHINAIEQQTYIHCWYINYIPLFGVKERNCCQQQNQHRRNFYPSPPPISELLWCTWKHRPHLLGLALAVSTQTASFRECYWHGRRRRRQWHTDLWISSLCSSTLGELRNVGHYGWRWLFSLDWNQRTTCM